MKKSLYNKQNSPSTNSSDHFKQNPSNPDKFHKYTTLISNRTLSKLQYNSFLDSINDRIKDSNKNYRMKNDLEEMKYLVTYNQKLHQKTANNLRKNKKQRENRGISPLLEFSYLDNQIKLTNQKLKKCQFLHGDPLIELKRSFSRGYFTSDSNKYQISIRQYKNLQQVDLKYKLQLLGIDTPQHKLEKIQMIIHKQLDKYKLSSSNDTQTKKLRCYILNHVILQQFLKIVCDNTQKIENKLLYKQIYKTIKQQMTSFMSNESYYLQKYQSILKYKESFEKEGQRKKIGPRKTVAKKGFFATAKNKENQLVEQIEKMFGKTLDYIKQACESCEKYNIIDMIEEQLAKNQFFGKDVSCDIN